VCAEGVPFGLPDTVECSAVQGRSKLLTLAIHWPVVWHGEDADRTDHGATFGIGAEIDSVHQRVEYWQRRVRVPTTGRESLPSRSGFEAAADVRHADHALLVIDRHPGPVNVGLCLSG
jgi:hypothetical protein